MVAPTASGGQPKGDPGAAAWIDLRIPPYFCALGLDVVVGVIGFTVVADVAVVGVAGIEVATGMVGFVVAADVRGVVGVVAVGVLQLMKTIVQNNMIVTMASSFFT